MTDKDNNDLKEYRIEAGAIVTTYKAASEQQALHYYAQDAGYKNYSHLVKEYGEVDSIDRID